MFSPIPSLAQEVKAPEVARPGPDERAREVAALKRDADRLKTEVAALKKQVEELKKAQGDMNVHVEMLLKHRHQLFLDFMRADAFFPQAKGMFFVTTPSPDSLTKTSGPVSGPK
jgi:transposase